MDEMINKYDVRDELWNERVNIAREKLSIHSEKLALQLEDSMENLSRILRQRTDDFEHLLTDKYEKRLQELQDAAELLEENMGKRSDVIQRILNEYKERQESSWKDFDPLRIEDLEDDKNYLIRWHDADGKYNVPHMSYWLDEEKSFFFLHIDCSIPARVHQYIEIPE